MRKTRLCLALLSAMLVAGCGGSIDSDMKKSPEDLQKSASSMSDSELESRLKELEQRVEKMGDSVGEREPSKAEEEEMENLIKVSMIYGMELAKRKMK